MYRFNPLMEYYEQEYDPDVRTVYTRKLQKQLVIEILTKYPTANDLKNTLINKKSKLHVLIDSNWDRQQYINFLKTNVVRYNPAKKNLLGVLAGIGITSASALLTVLGVMHGINNNFGYHIDGNYNTSDGASLGLGALGGAWLSKKFRKHLDDRDPDELI